MFPRDKKQEPSEQTTAKQLFSLRNFSRSSPAFGFVFLCMIFVYLECVLQFSAFGAIHARTFYGILFSLFAASTVFLVLSLFPAKARRIILAVFLVVFCLYYEIQFVYRGVFGSFMPLAQISLGTNAITNFTAQIFYCITQNIVYVLLLLLPIPFSIFMMAKYKAFSFAFQRRTSAFVLLTSALFFGIAFASLHITNTGASSAYAVLVSSNSSTDNCVKNVGLLATTVQEARYQINGDTESAISFANMPNAPVSLEGETSDYNMDESIDFTKLDKSDKTLTSLDTYFSRKTPTKKNEYTGMLEGYNLIMLCAESFSPHLISPELTPTLYKLSTNGFVFENYYCSFPNTTTAGEYAYCTGLMPDMYRTKTASSFDASSTNYLPYCMGNVFSDMGYPAMGYHNYYGTFYNRNITHPNMGYDFKAVELGLDIPLSWPASDKDMIEASIPEYIESSDPFCAYYMTFSGHYEYSWENAMSKKNQSAVENLPYSEAVKAYLACNLELEYALSSLMDSLQASGQADKTVIVLSADHYPYGLSEEQYNELAGETIDTAYEKYRNSFICYVPNMEPVIVSDYCSSIDVIPTLLNLFGADYDSRLLAGTDVLSDGEHMAVLSDQSYLTSDFRYNAATGEVTSANGEEPDSDLVQHYCNYVSDIFTVSTAILNNDYYAHVFGKQGGSTQAAAHAFSDIDDNDLFFNASASYVIDHEYMAADSETLFGGERIAQTDEFIHALYKFCEQDKKNPETSAADWAIQNGLIENESELSLPLTYGRTGVLISRCLAYQGHNISVDHSVLASLQAEFPNLTTEEICSLEWCRDKGIIMGGISTKAQDLANESISRFQMAAYLMRLCTYDFNE